MPVDWSKYPDNWKEISLHIRKVRAQDRCEWIDVANDIIPQRCDALNGQPNPITGSKVVLTVAHLDHDTKNNDPLNLLAMCQLHHNRYDAPHRAANRRKRKENGK